MRPLARVAAAVLATTLALAVAVPLEAARCRTASAQGCPLCHRAGATMAPSMSCCRTQTAPTPAPAGERPAPPSPLAVLPGATDALAVVARAGAPDATPVRTARAAESLHALGLFTLLAVFRN